MWLEGRMHACAQVCQTLVSTGTKAVFLNPTDALHGDIGIVGAHDLVVMVSKSGATEELLRLVPYAKARAALSTLCRNMHSQSPPLSLAWQEQAIRLHTQEDDHTPSRNHEGHAKRALGV